MESKSTASFGGICEHDRRPLDAVDEVAPDALHLAGALDAGDAADQRVDHRSYLEPRHPLAEAEVRAAAAERHVPVRRARDVEAPGLGELVWVEVGGGIPRHDLVARPNGLAAHLDVPFLEDCFD